MYLLVLDGVQGETLWEGESRARDHTHEREQKAGQAAVERTTLIVSQSLSAVDHTEAINDKKRGGGGALKSRRLFFMSPLVWLSRGALLPGECTFL